LGKYGKGEREPFAFSLLVREARRIARERQKDQISVVSLRTLISLAAIFEYGQPPGMVRASQLGEDHDWT
jgi:hypothetical protein